jgi:molybdopterin-containing oxidoreductase family membrane subunit
MTGPTKSETRYYRTLGVLAILVALAAVAWVYELKYGLGSTGMRNVISWGAYIFTFAFFVKLSAGGLIVASSAEIFGISELKPLARLGVLTAAASVIVAAITIVPDLGRPGRMLNLVLHPNWRSPMIWDLTIIVLYFVLAVTELSLMSPRSKSEIRQKRLKILAAAGLPAAFALHSITAWIFGLQISRAFWNTALMAPLFVVSAIACGTALIALIAAVLQRWEGVTFEEGTWRKLSALMAVSLAVDLFFVFCEYITVLWGNVPREVVALKVILPGGQFTSLFWLEWVVGGIVPFVLLVVPRSRDRVWAIVTGAALILVGVYAYQIQLTTVGMENPLIQLAPGISVGTYTSGSPVFQLIGQYAPTWVEYFILIGLIAFGMVVVTVGCRVFGIGEVQSSTVRGHGPMNLV